MSASKTLLIVDDSRVARMLIKGIVHDIKPEWEIIEAGDGDAALAEASKTQPDMAILDFNMPGIDGLTLAEKLLDCCHEIKISMLTANIQETIRSKAETLGVHFEKKPITEDKLTNIVTIFGN